jgi:hypothetical protein
MQRFDPLKYKDVTNNQIVDMLKHYNLYATTAPTKGLPDKISGPELLKLIASRLSTEEHHIVQKTVDSVNESDTYLTVIGERLRPGPEMAYVNLNVVQERIVEGTGNNFLRELTETIAKYNTPAVVERKPTEIAAEACLWAMEHNIFRSMGHKVYTLYLQLHKGVICSKYAVIATGKDWFITCVDK